MKIHFVENFSEGDADMQVVAMRKYFELVSPEEAELIYCGSISRMAGTIKILEETKKPLVVYCWDYYKWAHEGQSSWNWARYRGLLREAKLVFVPSHAQQRRLKELLGIDSVVVKSGAPVWDGTPTDNAFVLDPVRYYPEENRTWAEEAAKLLGIPIIHSEHQYTAEEFRVLVQSCTFLTCCYREASTGGLSLIEGLWHGKPSLVSDSPYMGARDYLGEFGTYFKCDDFDDLVAKMDSMWKLRGKFDTLQTRKYIEENLSYDVMAKNLHQKICEHFKN